MPWLRIGPFALALAGCGQRGVTVDFVEPSSGRGYRVIAPPAHDSKRKAPVLFALHAYATPPDALPESYSLAEEAGKKRGFLIVVPRGTNDSGGRPFWNASRACCGDTTENVDDLGYLRGVLADLGARYAVDEARVYALGVSNGAFMAHRWACSGGDLAGIAAISGVGPGPDDPPCAPSRFVRVLQIHGTADDTIRYEGGRASKGSYPSVRESTERWAKLDGCSAHRGPDSTRSILHGVTKVESWSGSGRCVLLRTFEGGEHNLRSVRFETAAILDFLDGPG
jgi:polyhydroxybutyrate depolymerase